MVDDHTIDGTAHPKDPDPGGPLDDALRRDIADELSDHLELSARAKQLGGVDEASAHQQAIEAFGNPDAIARRLYLSGIKSKLMRQNIQTGTLLVLTLSVIVLGVMAWSSFRESQGQMAEAIEANNDALIEALGAFTQSDRQGPADGLNPAEWANLTVELVDVDGKPIDAAGYNARLRGKLISPNDAMSLEQHFSRISVPDAFAVVEDQRTFATNSTVTFGPIRVGKHELTIDMPGGNGFSKQFITLWPGADDKNIRVVCPKPQTLRGTPSVTIDWPDDLKNEDVAFALEFRDEQPFSLGEQRWSAIPLMLLCEPGKPARIINGFGQTKTNPMVPTMTEDGFRMQSPEALRVRSVDGPTRLLPADYELAYEGLYGGLGDGTYQRFHNQGRYYFDAEYDRAANTFHLKGWDKTWEAVRSRVEPIQRFRTLPDAEKQKYLEPYGKYGVVVE